MITLKDVSKEFTGKNKAVKAVDAVNLTIQSGEIFGIVGYSGAGKSTLVRMLNGLEKPTSGTVTLNDKIISTMSGQALRKERRAIGMIFQHFNLLWSRTVLENICFPLEIAKVEKTERIKRAKELIELVGLQGREDAYPAQLSGGQKQRVGIARALANEPQVLLCDEATSALDPQTTDDVLDLLVSINKKMNLTIVMITHEMHVVRKICHRMAVMDGGKVVEEGEVLSLFKHPAHPTTKRFIRQDSDPDSEDTDEVLRELLKTYPEGKLIRLLFHGGSAQAPVISHVSRSFNVDVNIIQGSMQSTQETPIGTLTIQLLGEEAAVEEAIKEFRVYRVEVEVLNDALQ
ncbi:methionine ABC transporter ATP-binding protein [Lacticigenium naphthae]|uniref:methionine ABC transporter ATP-binding protein n=1 Tax=Lacticigenium naphthae TaxID=515351 RepID=UPI00041B314B|nr:methionine ABC transporter ATP-binding protein [Lacticigenium naphthae]